MRVDFTEPQKATICPLCGYEYVDGFHADLSDPRGNWRAKCANCGTLYAVDDQLVEEVREDLDRQLDDLANHIAARRDFEPGPLGGFEGTQAPAGDWTPARTGYDTFLTPVGGAPGPSRSSPEGRPVEPDFDTEKGGPVEEQRDSAIHERAAELRPLRSEIELNKIGNAVGILCFLVFSILIVEIIDLFVA